MSLQSVYSLSSLDLKIEPLGCIASPIHRKDALVPLLLLWVLFHDHVQDLLEMQHREYFSGIFRVLEQELGEVEDAVLQLPLFFEHDADRLRFLF